MDTVVGDETAKLFLWQDYAVFASMLAVSAAIGVYYGFSCKKNTPDVQAEEMDAGDLLTGGGKLKTIPVGLSVLASFVSSVTLMGHPAEIYYFGPQLWLFGISSFMALPIVCYFFVPFFRSLNSCSAYDYFGKRFNRSFQLFASTIYTLEMLIFCALVLYAPALAFHQVTGINYDIVIISMYVVCIFYTTVGGIKAVVWTDSLQVVILYGAMIVILIQGTIDIGGISAVWNRNVAHGRGTFFNFNPDPTIKYSVWSVSVGGAFLHMSIFCGNQLQIQRFMSVTSEKEAKKLVWVYAIGWALIILLTTYIGMLIFAKYADCDPVLNKSIRIPNQLLPLYVMDILGSYKGFPGLAVAGIFSAGLSTVSTGMNSLAAIWFAELDGTSFKAKISPQKGVLVVKLLALFFGLLSFALVYLVPYMGNLAPIAISLNGIFSGALCGIFILGMYFPLAEVWGAFCGLSSGVGFLLWLTIGIQTSMRGGYEVYETLPVSTEGCSSSNGTFTSFETIHEKPPAFVLYRISFMYHTAIALFITIIIGILVSYTPKYVSSTMFRFRSSLGSRGFRGSGNEMSFISGGGKEARVYLPEGRESEPKLIEEVDIL